MNLQNGRQQSPLLDAPITPLTTRTSGIALWRPDIVVPKTIVRATAPPKVMIAEPGQRPEAVRAQVEATRSLLDSLAGAREALRARTADLEHPVVGGGERERVTAMIETYRAKSALDEALRRATTMIDTRGQR